MKEGPLSFLRSKRFQSAVGLLISVGILGYLAVSVEWSAVWKEILRVNYWLLLPSIAIMVFHLLLRAWRWRYLLPGGRDVPILDMYHAIIVGCFATFVLPLRAGEFVRPYFLSVKAKQGFAGAFVSVVIERFFDLSAVLLSFSLMVQAIPGIPPLARDGAASLGILAGLLLAFMIVGSIFPQLVLRVFELCSSPLPQGLRNGLRKFIGELLMGTVILKRPENLFMVVGLTLVVWASCYLQYYVFIMMFQVDPSVWLAMSIAVMIALAVAAPSAPGFIGVYQVGCLAAFGLFGVSGEIAVAFSVVTHAFQFFLMVIYGIGILWSSKLSLGRLRGDIPTETFNNSGLQPEAE